MFNYNILSTGLVDAHPIYLQYVFSLSSNQITNTVDLRRGFVAALALFGGFVLASYGLLSLLVCACRNFQSEKKLIEELYTFTPEHERHQNQQQEVDFVVNH